MYIQASAGGLKWFWEPAVEISWTSLYNLTVIALVCLLINGLGRLLEDLLLTLSVWYSENR
ncbi:hypothetical protein A6X21_05060 [Planctopirus hydrillae]|uniref:Uncharacterized protein n=1 Tax=Planctopirus hydrillae TaxID=1841610 RepID=A0A1C3EIR5_9PLAN|nr:hypothetical protein A6X21_05060 [Planctopirus hydrillae]